MNNLFYYTKQERRGIFILVFLIVFVALIPSFLPKKQTPESTIDYEVKLQALVAQRDSLRTKNEQPKQKYSSPPKEQSKAKYEPKEESPKKTREKPKTEYKPYQPKSTNISIDVNKASASEFAQLKGIGEVLSNRIVKFRDKLGGFYSIEQVGTTYGVEPDVFNSIKTQLTISGGIKQLNINTSSADQLSSHPYISPKLANQMVNFREKVKPFESDEDIKKLYLMNDELFKKLRPYLVY